MRLIASEGNVFYRLGKLSWNLCHPASVNSIWPQPFVSKWQSSCQLPLSQELPGDPNPRGSFGRPARASSLASYREQFEAFEEQFFSTATCREVSCREVRRTPYASVALQGCPTARKQHELDDNTCKS